MTDIQTWLDEGTALAVQATEGPWETEGDNPSMSGSTWKLRIAGKPGVRMKVYEYQHNPGNAAFIADARTRLPQALKAIQAVLDPHKPVDVEPYGTICAACSNRLPNGRFLPIVEYPCPPVQAIQNVLKTKENQ